MKRQLLIIIGLLSCFTLKPAEAAQSVFGNDSFVIAKAVKIGRSATASKNSFQELNGSKMNNTLLKCDAGSYSTSKGCVSCSSTIKGCTLCDSEKICKTCTTGYVLDGTTCKESDVEPDKVCNSSNNYYWNADGAKTVPAGYSCIDGYGANSSVYLPSGANYTSTNLRFWNGATVSGALTTKDLKSLSHTSSRLSGLSPTITFTSPVTVTGAVYLQEAVDGGKGVTMRFNGGLKGSPRCVVEKRRSSSGCGWASCSEKVATDTICKCSASECKILTCAEGEVIQDGKCVAEAPVTCNSTNNYFWNADGSKTVPAGYSCIDGYGSSATVTFPSNASYGSVNLRFWSGATVTNSFSTKDLKSLSNTSWYASSLNATITFNQPVTVTGAVYLQEASVGGKGITMKFNGGLKGNPRCVVKRMIETNDCPWASCTKEVETTSTCTCTSSQCKIN